PRRRRPGRPRPRTARRPPTRAPGGAVAGRAAGSTARRAAASEPMRPRPPVRTRYRSDGEELAAVGKPMRPGPGVGIARLADETLIVDRQASTGSYLALLQADGQLVAGVYDTAVLRSITPRAVHRWHRHLRNAALVVADANLRPQTLAVIAALCRRYGVGL